MLIISGMVGWYPPIHYGRQTELLARLAGRCRSAACLSAAGAKPCLQKRTAVAIHLADMVMPEPEP